MRVQGLVALAYYRSVDKLISCAGPGQRAEQVNRVLR